MSSPEPVRRFRAGVFSVVKHDYLPLAVAAHPRFELVVVADDASQPGWVHDRNQTFADRLRIPYVRNVARAIAEFNLDLAVVSSQAERHCDLSIRAIKAGLHVIQDKPMSTRLSECDRVLEALGRNRVRFLLWNRNFSPSLLQARELMEAGAIGKPFAIHADFYFSKDSGPPKGSRSPGEKPIGWLERQLEAHRDGSDGGVGNEPMGELAIEGIYPLAYIKMLTNGRVRRVFARTASHFHQVSVDNNVDDLATVSLEFDDGLLGSLCLGRIGAASHPDLGEIKLHVLGSKGALVIAEARPEISVHYRGQPPLEFRNQRLGNENDHLLLEDFAGAIDEDRDPVLAAKAGRDICATVEAALRSAHSGRVEEVAG